MNKYKKYIIVKFSKNNRTYNFAVEDKHKIKKGDFVVVETVKGLELAEVVSNVLPIANYQLDIDLKPILRIADKDDKADYEYNIEEGAEALKICRSEVERLKLNMDLISAEYTLDRSKLSFTYISDDRVDFRELLKSLATEFKCRIDLRQIGARDKAKITGGVGMCGRELCCTKYLDNFGIVSINMAKNQMLALNTNKLSGQCGKLMCCLKYEDQNYTDQKKDLPKIGSELEYEGNLYKLAGYNVINQICKLESQDQNILVPLTAIQVKGKYKND